MAHDPYRRDDEDEARDERRSLVRVILVALVAAALGLAVAGAMRKAFATEGKPVMFDCADLALGIAGFAEYRDVGARLELVVRSARAHNERFSAPEMAALEREIRRMWREGLPGDEAAAAVYRRCRAQLGDMGRES